MRAAVQRSYGPPEVLKIEDVEQPSIRTDIGVLIRAHATSVNPADYMMRKGPLAGRLISGLTKPKQPIPGMDVAGIVEAVGKNVTRFKVGDRVFGSCNGSYAEYVRTAERSLSLIPVNVTFEQAAAMPCVGQTALQALRDVAQIKPGQKVLVYGASGGIGHVAVQLAKVLGASEVTAVCSTANLAWVKDLGADHLIDYTREDFSKNGKKYDIILDAVGRRTYFNCLRSLNDPGVYISEFFIRPIYLPVQLALSPLFGGKKAKIHIAKANAEDLGFLAGLMAEGKLRPVIEKSYPLDQAAAAQRHAERGHTKGKVVISI